MYGKDDRYTVTVVFVFRLFPDNACIHDFMHKLYRCEHPSKAIQIDQLHMLTSRRIIILVAAINVYLNYMSCDFILPVRLMRMITYRRRVGTHRERKLNVHRTNFPVWGFLVANRLPMLLLYDIFIHSISMRHKAKYK